MPKHHVFSFGELLLRIQSSAERLLYAEDRVTVYPGGSEANVAASLAQWGVRCSYVTRLPDHELAKQALDALGVKGVDTTRSLVGGDRMGVYFLLSADGLAKGDVIYDRKHSSFGTLAPGMVDWDALLEGHTWLHWSALTPALSQTLADTCLELLDVASRKGLTISVDLNYRNKLWAYGKEPVEVMPELVRYCDVVMGNVWAANKMLGTNVSHTLTRTTPPDVYFEQACRTADEIWDAFPRCKHVANTFRFMDRPTHNLLYGTYHTRAGNYLSAIFETDAVLDRIGSGDAFMAGLIYALTEGMAPQQVVEMATRAGFQKLFAKGDFGNGALTDEVSGHTYEPHK